MKTKADHDAEFTRLRAENARLIGLLEAHGIKGHPVGPDRKPSTVASSLTAAEKVALFRRLFRGRTDVYPVRWESKAGKSGYAPACANEWRPGVCEKPRIKCADCNHRQLIPLTEQAIFDHLAGRHTIGVYPLLADDGCHFLAVDFDAADWRADAQAFVQSCRELDVPVALEISRSGSGAHAWVFFSSVVPARDARRLGTAVISHTCARTRQLRLASYDRLFPNQDALPKGGFGNLIALPLQKAPRERDASVFVDDDECHHLSAFSFEAILKRVRARYVLGLTATPIRRDGRQPILFMQCGPIRHAAARPTGAPQTLEVVPRYLPAGTMLPADTAIQEVFRRVAGDAIRTATIADEIARAFEQGRKVLALTERADHLDTLRAALADRIRPLFVLHGRLTRKQRAKVIAELDALDADAPRVLLATGRLVGEGFDHPPLDTLVLAMPISWKGTLQQYAGRLHREHADKTHVRIIDFIDACHPSLPRMWERRQRGYRAMGYRIASEGSGALNLESTARNEEGLLVT